MKYMLFNTEMTKAVLDGRKTQTRRVISEKIALKLKEWNTIKSLEAENFEDVMSFKFKMSDDTINTYHGSIKTKYQIGDILWVREPARINAEHNGSLDFTYLADSIAMTIPMPYRLYKDIRNKKDKQSAPDLCLPNWIIKNQGIPNGCIKEMARIFLKVTDVRVERLKDMETSDMLKEGVSEFKNYEEFRDRFSPYDTDEFIQGIFNIKNEWVNLWNSTAPKGYKWKDNPYVFVYEFERVKK